MKNSPFQNNHMVSLQLPPPPPPNDQSECPKSHRKPLTHSPSISHSDSENYCQSLTYSVSSQSFNTASKIQVQQNSESDYDSFTDIIHVQRRVMKLAQKKSCIEFKCNTYRFQMMEFVNHFGTLCIIGVTYFVLCLLLGTELLFPGTKLFILFFTWLMSMLGGFLVGKIGLPPLLGMLLSGLFVRHFANEVWLVLPETWISTIRTSSLALILLRSGLELDLAALKKSGLAAFRLTLIPGVIEAITCAFVSYYIFNMPIFLALSFGFILAAVSPAVVLVGMFELQKYGYGVKQGVPSLVVAAASFDDIVAISGFTFCISIAIKSETSNSLLSALHGPINIAIGLGMGTIGGIIIACTKIWNRRWKRSCITFILGMALTFGLSKIHYPGGGTLAAMIMGMITSFCWKKEYPKFWTGSNVGRFLIETQEDIALCWSVMFEPLLFGVIGMSLNFNEMQIRTIPKCILIVCIGLIVRLPSAYLSVSGQKFNWKERLFIALSWAPKATVQAALCSIPLELIHTTIIRDNDNYDQYVEWGKEILSTGKEYNFLIVIH